MNTPIVKARNLGPVCAREFARLGIYTLEHLRDLGWKEACLMWAERFPSRINLNAFRSVIGAVYDVDWNRIPPEEDADARRTLDQLRRQKRAAEAEPVQPRVTPRRAAQRQAARAGTARRDPKARA
jgi:hypothetical protein